MSSAFDRDKLRAKERVTRVRIPGWDDEAAQRKRETSRSPKKKSVTIDKIRTSQHASQQQQANDSRQATEIELPRVVLKRKVFTNARPSLKNSPNRLVCGNTTRRDNGSFFGSLNRGARNSVNTQYVTIT